MHHPVSIGKIKCMVSINTCGSACAKLLFPILIPVTAVTITIAVVCPIERMVASTDAMLLRFFSSAQLITTLVLGAANSAEPIPDTANTAIRKQKFFAEKTYPIFCRSVAKAVPSES